MEMNIVMGIKRNPLTTCAWAVIFIQFFLSSCSSDASTIWRENLKKCSRENKFACLLINSGNTSEDKIMRELLLKFTNKQPDKIGVIEIDFKNEQKLEQSLVSPEEADLFLSLQQGKAVFLCFYKQQSKELEGVKSELGAIEKFFKGRVVAQYHNVGDVSDSSLLKKLPPFNRESVTVLTLLPPGQLKSKLEGDEIKRVNLLKAFQGGCCPPGGGKDAKKDCK